MFNGCKNLENCDSNDKNIKNEFTKNKKFS